MKFRQPLVLLLGSVLSASGLGCSAITALVGDSRPATREGRDTSERMVAIAQVFEHQGRYDQAEVMYRKALKANPNNGAVREQLQQLAERKSSKKFEASPANTSIAKKTSNSRTNTASADSAGAVKKSSGLSAVAAANPLQAVVPVAASVVASESSSAEKSVAMPSNQAELKQPVVVTPILAEQESVPQEMPTVSSESQTVDASSITFASALTETANTTEVTKVSGESATTVAAAPEPVVEPVISTQPTSRVTSEEVLAAVDFPAENAELLLNGLQYGDSLETQCLAATLLGDCSPDDEAIRRKLKKANQAAVDPQLRLAICNSRIQRMEHDAITADCLMQLITTAPAELGVQACSEMRHFVGSQWDEKCVAVLMVALESESPELRAGAAVTLGDFSQLPDSAQQRLQGLSRSDSDASVREAATSAIARRNTQNPMNQ